MMADWGIWLLLAGGLVVLEMFTGTFYLLMIAIGLCAGGVAAFVGSGMPAQFIMATVVGVIATISLHRTRLAKQPRTMATRNPDVLMDIGQTVRVKHWSGSPDGTRTARVSYRGADWDVELEQGAALHLDAQLNSDEYLIREVRGSRLIVVPAIHHH
jgi:membrane protein implicated in regulation of membrane protease activity